MSRRPGKRAPKPPPAAPATPAARRPWWKVLVVGAGVALLSPLLAISSETFKGLYDGWFTECRIIIEKGAFKPLATGEGINVPVRIFANGQPPGRLHVAFSTNDPASRPVLRRVVLDHDEAVGNLAIHPDTGRACPGQICGDSDLADGGSYRDIMVRLDPFRTTFDYLFLVIMAVPAGGPTAESLAGSLQVSLPYTKDDAQPTAIVCRGEMASPANLHLRMSDLWKFMLFGLAVAMLGAGVALLKPAEAKE